MFFGLTKLDFSFQRWKTALPYFLTLFLSFALLLFIVVFGLRGRLCKAELDETKQLLDRYLLENRFASLQFGPVLSGSRSRLQGLEFVIITRGEDRLLIAGEKTPHAVLEELLHLDSTLSEPWYRLENNNAELVMSVIALEFDFNATVQAGKISSDSFQLYREIVHYSISSLFIAFFLSWLVGLFCAKRIAAPLVTLKSELENISSGSHLLPVPSVDGELGMLYKEVNRVLESNHKLVEEIRGALDNVAHDLRTPMTRLRSVAEFGLREENDTEKLRDSLADCLEESERVLAMLKIMMSVAEAESGTMQLNLQPIDLKESLEEMVSLYEYVAEEKKIEIRTNFTPNITILADRAAISQVWGNLLDNAIKYGKEGGWIEIETERIDSTSQILFRDNGMGISSSEQDRIWDRLYRGDRSRSQQGLGLGLNFVKAVVEAHGGDVEVASVLHEGSCFTVRIDTR